MTKTSVLRNTGIRTCKVTEGHNKRSYFPSDIGDHLAQLPVIDSGENGIIKFLLSNPYVIHRRIKILYNKNFSSALDE